jgi:hypothetical protein
MVAMSPTYQSELRRRPRRRHSDSRKGFRDHHLQAEVWLTVLHRHHPDSRRSAQAQALA